MAGLGPEESDGDGSLGGAAPFLAPHDLAAVAVNAARDINGDAIELAAVDCLDNRKRPTLHRPRQAGSEKRVDHQRLAVEDFGGQVFDFARPLAGVDGGVAGQFFRRPQQRQAHRPAGFG